MLEQEQKSVEMTSTDADRLAELYNSWMIARNADLRATSTSSQKELLKSTPTVSGRPSWISKLSESEQSLFDEAVKRRAESQKQ